MQQVFGPEATEKATFSHEQPMGPNIPQEATAAVCDWLAHSQTLRFICDIITQVITQVQANDLKYHTGQVVSHQALS